MSDFPILFIRKKEYTGVFMKTSNCALIPSKVQHEYVTLFSTSLYPLPHYVSLLGEKHIKSLQRLQWVFQPKFLLMREPVDHGDIDTLILERKVQRKKMAGFVDFLRKVFDKEMRSFRSEADLPF